jgi:hypothetical protein
MENSIDDISQLYCLMNLEASVGHDPVQVVLSSGESGRVANLTTSACAKAHHTNLDLIFIQR